MSSVVSWLHIVRLAPWKACAFCFSSPIRFSAAQPRTCCTFPVYQGFTVDGVVLQLDKDRKALLERKKTARAADKGKGKVSLALGVGMAQCNVDLCP